METQYKAPRNTTTLHTHTHTFICRKLGIEHFCFPSTFHITYNIQVPLVRPEHSYESSLQAEVHLGPVLSPLFFIVVLQAITGIPNWVLMGTAKCWWSPSYMEHYPLKTFKYSPIVKELVPFESVNFVTNITFHKYRNSCQTKTKFYIKIFRSSKMKFAFSDKTNNLYEVTNGLYDKLLTDTISTEHIKSEVLGH